MRSRNRTSRMAVTSSAELGVAPLGSHRLADLGFQSSSGSMKGGNGHYPVIRLAGLGARCDSAGHRCQPVTLARRRDPARAPIRSERLLDYKGGMGRYWSRPDLSWHTGNTIDIDMIPGRRRLSVARQRFQGDSLGEPSAR